jgi:MinD superfamily P-loop ATPase
MNEIVVLSGKGGTGKTSITAALSALAGKDAVIADCDVDAADMHLLLQPDFAESFEFFSGELAAINHALCTRCGKCAEICRFDAISFLNDQYQVSELDCDGCGYCEKICPESAFTMLEKQSGHVYISKTRLGNTLVHATMNIGAENSGKLVARVKSEAKAIALRENLQLVIVDGSPGIGCPVVSALSGATYVILITEPTMSGIHDLTRVYAIVNKFRIQAGCIINKYDLNMEKTAEIKCFLKENKIGHLADIPFNNHFTSAMIEGKTIAEMQSPLKPLIENIWRQVYDPVKNGMLKEI